MEFMAILWLKDSSPHNKSGRSSSILPESRYGRYHAEDVIQFRQRRQYRGQRRREEKYQEPDTLLNLRGIAPESRAKQVESDAGHGYEERKQQQQQQQQHKPVYHPHHPHQVSDPTIVTPEQINEASTNDPSPTRTGIRTGTRTGLGSSRIMSLIPKPPFKATKALKDRLRAINLRNPKASNSRKSVTKSSKQRAQEKNQRGGFKSTEERKLAQLIPAVDENGHLIEDHFISPRDSDGDGIPDFYVLLRPTVNSEYMMDIGLFDDETMAPAPVPPTATVTVTATATAISAAPVVPTLNTLPPEVTLITTPPTSPLTAIFRSEGPYFDAFVMGEPLVGAAKDCGNLTLARQDIEGSWLGSLRTEEPKVGAYEGPKDLILALVKD
ncbi:hypothetical protein BGX31_009236 [Mortierella sp. GBA43]|nr:hypothetical protein BGX31_009236 [Mortierella sp. GBA43]